MSRGGRCLYGMRENAKLEKLVLEEEGPKAFVEAFHPSWLLDAVPTLAYPTRPRLLKLAIRTVSSPCDSCLGPVIHLGPRRHLR